MAEISEVFNHPGAGFVTLPAGIKFPPQYKEWQKPENARTFQQAQDHAAKGGNVGILGGNGHIGFDKDDPAAFDGLELSITTLWETRPGRYGLRFVVSDDIPAALATIGKKPDLAQIYLYRDGKQCGEIKFQRSYQIIPPSWKTLEDGTRADYKMLDSSPPATINLAKLLADLQAIGITFDKTQKKSRLDANAVRLGSMASLVDQMLSLHKQLYEAHTPHEQTALERQIEATDHQIDALVYELYGLTEEEIGIVKKGAASYKPF